jgi:arylsulfatase A-like enzyme
MFAGATAPRTPSFNEADVSDKPAHVRNLPTLTAARIAAIDQEYQARLESLQAVDEGVEQIINALEANGELENTFIIFTSDNGYRLGQHRFLNGKGDAYEEDIRVPLLVRGPGVREGASLDQMALNIDFAPTIAELAQATPGRAMDGRSLTPLLVSDTHPSHNWRKDFLVEIYRVPAQNAPPAKALRTRHELYVEHADGFRELYDLRADPYQLNNVFSSADKGHVKQLSERLAELLVSGGESSRNVTSSAPGSSVAPAEQVRVNPFFAGVWESGQTVLDSVSDQAGHSDDESLALAIVDAVQAGARSAAT